MDVEEIQFGDMSKYILNYLLFRRKHLCLGKDIPLTCITDLYKNKNDNIHKNEVQDIRWSDEYWQV